MGEIARQAVEGGLIFLVERGGGLADLVLFAEDVEEDGEPETSGEDNLKTLRLVFAAYRSMTEKRAVQAEEIASGK